MFAVLRKSFPMAETDALIEFVGGQLANSAVPCALGGLRFVRGGEPLPPPAVPPILLSEAWNDYHAIAAAGAGFDPDWQAKVRW